jgi:hypothetical protein
MVEVADSAPENEKPLLTGRELVVLLCTCAAHLIHIERNDSLFWVASDHTSSLMKSQQPFEQVAEVRSKPRVRGLHLHQRAVTAPSWAKSPHLATCDTGSEQACCVCKNLAPHLVSGTEQQKEKEQAGNGERHENRGQEVLHQEELARAQSRCGARYWIRLNARWIWSTRWS